MLGTRRLSAKSDALRLGEISRSRLVRLFLRLNKHGELDRLPLAERTYGDMARTVPYSKAIVEDNDASKVSSSSCARLIASKESMPAVMRGVSGRTSSRPVTRCTASRIACVTVSSPSSRNPCASASVAESSLSLTASRTWVRSATLSFPPWTSDWALCACAMALIAGRHSGFFKAPW
eukprot:scaffold156177_cov31-Tisochrysis_lutea.AAC.4